MLYKQYRFGIRSNVDRCHRLSKFQVGPPPNPVKEDFAIPSCGSDERSITFVAGGYLDDIFLMVTSFIEDSVFFMVVKHGLTGHSRRDRPYASCAKGNACEDRAIMKVAYAFDESEPDVRSKEM